MMRYMINILAMLAVLTGGFFLAAVFESEQPRSLTLDNPPSPTAELRYNQLVRQVAPVGGTTINVQWADMGQKLVDAGAIDLDKFETAYRSLSEEQIEILQGDSLDQITFTPENIRFWTNVLWALGLTQESRVLGEGLMMQRQAEVPLGNYASTGGWTLGSQAATELYNSVSLIELTPEQDEMVFHVAENIYRPCCGNHTAYPDCNHGMAVLGLLELMASQGASEAELYQAALVFNSYAFMDSYISLSAYFALQGIPWSEVDASYVLGADYSSSQGIRQVAAQVGPIPGAPGQGSSCST